MKIQSRSLACWSFAAGMFLLASVSLQAQTATGAIPLVSDACPTVAAGGRIALDWNPLFDTPGIVNGLAVFEMQFKKVDEDGVNLTPVVIAATTRRTAHAITPLGNDFYHIELTVAQRVAPGVYRLFRANASATIDPNYQGGPKVEMTDSPVRARLCITVVRPQDSTSSQSTVEEPSHKAS
jgi:hypothetical protein